jgi:ABC-2 type transport system permease protein
MSFSVNRVLIIARREYMTTVRRKAFVFSLLLTPAILFVTTFLSQKLSGDEFKKHFQMTRIVAVVDSSGLYANAPRAFDYHPPAERASAVQTQRATQPPPSNAPVQVIVRPFADQVTALDSLTAGTVNSVLVVSSDYLTTGHVRRYENDTRAITASGDDRPLRYWLTKGLVVNVLDSSRTARVWALGNSIELYTPTRTGGFAVKDDSRELTAFFFPFVLGFLLGMAIMTGGQYLLTGVSEEKESRILESLLCTVSPDELLAGKLIGLGSAGLTLVGVWIVVGFGIMGATLSALNIDMPPQLLVLAVLYFAFGYLFFASLMTGIGAMSNNMREAQQFSIVFSMMNFFPFWVMMAIINSPNGPLAVGLSLFPPTAATTMMMRLSTVAVSGTVIPGWQVAASLGLLAVTSIGALLAASKVFRLGLLLYGKTPNLPEILAVLRQK